MKWVYYDYMGKMNPVCEDAGKILRIVPNFPKVQGTFSNIQEIETDVGRFGCDTRYSTLLYGGYCFFEPIHGDGEQTEFVDLTGIKHGETVDVKTRGLYLIDGFGLMPITTDPRILCIMHRAHDLNNPTEKELFDFCKHIPDRKEAVAYLRSIHAETDCLPECAIQQKLNSEERR